MSFSFDRVVDLQPEEIESEQSFEDLAGLFIGKKEIEEENDSSFEQELDALLDSIGIDLTFDELESLIMDVPDMYSEEDEVPGRCCCGSSRFSLKLVQSQLKRTCKKCGVVRWL